MKLFTLRAIALVSLCLLPLQLWGAKEATKEGSALISAIKNARPNFGFTGKHTKIALDLLEENAKLALDKDSNGDTALISAARVSNPKIIKALIKAGAKLNERNNQGDTALITAASIEAPSPDIINILIAAYADVNVQDNIGNTALICAARGFTDAQDDIAEANRNPNPEMAHAEASQPEDSLKSYLKIVKALIKAGAWVKITNKAGETALTIAVTEEQPSGLFGSSYDLLSAILQGIILPRDQQLVDAALKQTSNPKVTKLIEKAKVKNDLVEAAKTGQSSKVKRLLEQGADVDTQDENDNTLLMLANLTKRNPRTTDALLEKNPNFEIKNNNGDTALIIAARNGFASIIEKFFNKKTMSKNSTIAKSIDIQNEKGQTALIAASHQFINFKNRTLNAWHDYDPPFGPFHSGLEKEDLRSKALALENKRDAFLSIVNLLIKAGADIGIEATEENEYSEIVTLRNGQKKYSALSVAIVHENNDHTLLKALLKGIDPKKHKNAIQFATGEAGNLATLLKKNGHERESEYAEAAGRLISQAWANAQKKAQKEKSK